MHWPFKRNWSEVPEDVSSDPMAGTEAKAEQTVYWVGAWIVLGLAVTTAAAWEKCALALLIALAATAVGGGVGFLFGIPLAGDPPLSDEARREGGAGAAAPNPLPGMSGLEQVADWLTKILIGVGLTQITVLRGHLVTLGTWVGEAAGPASSAANPSSGKVFGIALLCYFGATGFIFGTLATRLILVRLMLWSKWHLTQMRDKIRSVDQKLPSVLRAAEKAFASNAQSLERASASARGAGGGVTEAEGWEPGKPVSVADDPQQGRFGGQAESGGRRLTATVGPQPGSAGELFLVRIQVAASDPARPLDGPVKFFLHSTFSPDRVVVAPHEGTAELELVAWGAFTVGALADGGKTRLELNLAELESAPAKFRSR